MKKTLITLGLLTAGMAHAYLPALKPATLKPRFVAGTKTLQDFADRSLSLAKLDINLPVASEYMTFAASCGEAEIKRAEYKGGFRPSVSEGDFYVMNHPEECETLNFNHIVVKPHDIKANQLEIRLGTFEYRSMNRYSSRDLHRDPPLTHSTSFIVTCSHEYSTRDAAWTVDFFRCTLPNSTDTILFRVNGGPGNMF